ncbi:(Fe-S)-binding protein [Chloroflexota bacterium]
MAGKDLVPPGLLYLADNISSKHNILGTSKTEGAKWAKDLGLPRSSDTLFFAGCGYQYMSDLTSLTDFMRKMDKSAIGAERMIGVASFQKKIGIDAAGLFRKVVSKGDKSDAQPLLDAIKVLTKMGYKLGYLGEDEPCCGGLLYYTGLHEEFTKNSKKFYETAKANGVKKIIGMVPSCTYTIRDLAPKFVDGYDLEVRHFLEAVVDKLPSVKLNFPRPVKVTYHDPCQLARFFKLIDAPRQILKSIKNIEFVEPDWTKGEYTTCCGGGAGFEAVFPEMSEILAVNRVKELTDTGAEIIVTNCPGCIIQLRNGLKELKNESVQVLDMAQVLAMAMEEE